MVAIEIFDAVARFAFFAGGFIVIGLLEAWLPRRRRSYTRRARWPHNLGVALVNQIVVRFLLPISAIALATYWHANDGGLLGTVALPGWLEFLLALLLLDFAIYLQHRLFHMVPFLWRLHAMHHADQDFDVTTGIRFHPASILFSAIIKLGAVVLLGPSAMAVLVFEVLLNLTSMFNHSNLRLPLNLDRRLRLVVVTPDMHRVHHSTESAELNRNFGFNFPWWDRLFGTYLEQPAAGHEGMAIGLTDFRTLKEQQVGRMLTQPWRHPTA